jgi:hypothetical protein
MSNVIRKRCPKCKGTDIYRRRSLKDIIARSKCVHAIRSDVPSNIYHCYRCGYEFDIPFVGPKK